MQSASPGRNPVDSPYSSPFRWSIVVAGLVAVVIDVAAVLLALATLTVPSPVIYGLTAAAGLLVGGSFLIVAYRWRAGVEPSTDAAVRVVEVIVSVTVVTQLAAFAAICGLVLLVSAKLGGPDPKTSDGELLGNRLLDWIERNREFMRNNGKGTLPITP